MSRIAIPLYVDTRLYAVLEELDAEASRLLSGLPMRLDPAVGARDYLMRAAVHAVVATCAYDDTHDASAGGGEGG